MLVGSASGCHTHPRACITTEPDSNKQKATTGRTRKRKFDNRATPTGSNSSSWEKVKLGKSGRQQRISRRPKFYSAQVCRRGIGRASRTSVLVHQTMAKPHKLVAGIRTLSRDESWASQIQCLQLNVPAPHRNQVKQRKVPGCVCQCVVCVCACVCVCVCGGVPPVLHRRTA